MKKILCILFIGFCTHQSGFSQVKITLATKQKTFGGMGGVLMNYVIQFKSKTDAVIEIDSVKTVAEAQEISFSFYKNDKGYYEMTNSQPVKSAAKCKTCPDTTPKLSNLSKGVIVYYKNGNEKHFFKVKKFKQLPDLMLP